MIDKIDVRVPAQTPYSRGFGSLYGELRRSPDDPFRDSRHYGAVADLRPYGYEAILHAHCKHGRKGNHKLELLDTGSMTYPRMRTEIERLFAVHANTLPLMRIDLAADVRDVPVSWFMHHVRARYKRSVADIGKTEYSRMGKAEVETLYLGKRPNCFRIYNKIAESQQQYQRLKRRKADADLPSFESLYGYSESDVLTRVERQIGGGQVPSSIEKFGQLVGIADFDPFERLEVVPNGIPEPDPRDYELNFYLRGMGLRTCIEREGIHRTKSWLNKKSTRNASRILKKHKDLIPHSEHELDAGQIREIYRESVRRQLAA